jgi:methionine-S-sulfoxide reductase
MLWDVTPSRSVCSATTVLARGTPPNCTVLAHTHIVQAAVSLQSVRTLAELGCPVQTGDLVIKNQMSEAFGREVCMSSRVVLISGLALSALLVVGLIVLPGLGQQSNDSGSGSVESAGPSRGGETTFVWEEIPNDVVAATFAGVCLWCTESSFQETAGVSNAISGYSGGTEYNPTYKDVYTGSTGHRESLRVYFDPDEVSYERLLDLYWGIIDPTDGGGQFVDRGMPYTTAIFYHNEAQRRAAEKSKRALEKSGRFDSPIVTEILPFTTFYEAEKYHQDFYKTSSERYEQYANASGREEFKELVWSEIDE